MIIVDINETYDIESEIMPGHTGTFKPVTPRERGKYMNMVLNGRQGEMPVQVFENHMINFTPLKDKKGNNVPFMKDEHLLSIPFEVQVEMGRRLLEFNKLTEEEIKN